MKKRAIALFMAAVMLLGLVQAPMKVKASDGAEPLPIEATESTELSTEQTYTEEESQSEEEETQAESLPEEQEETEVEALPIEQEETETEVLPTEQEATEVESLPETQEATEAESTSAETAQTEAETFLGEKEIEFVLTEDEFYKLQQQEKEKELVSEEKQEEQAPVKPVVLPSGLVFEDNISRAKWLQNLELLFELTAEKDDYPDNYYTDLSEEYEYYDVMMIAVYHGLIDDEPGEEVHPDDPATRDFAAHTLNHLLGRVKEAESYSFSDASSGTWPDDAQVAVEMGWLELASGAFNPQQSLSAAEVTAAAEAVEAFLESLEPGSGTSSYSFADWVIQIPEMAEVAASFSDDLETLTITIANWDGTLNAGDTFVFFDEGFAYVYGAASVSKTDGVYAVVTEDAPEGAILSFEYDGVVSPEIFPVIRDVDKKSYEINTVEYGKVQLGPVQPQKAGKFEISYNRDISTQIDGVKGKLTAKAKDFKVTKKLMGAQKYVKVTCKLEFSCSLELTLDDAAGTVPMGGVTVGVAYFGLELQLKASAKIAYTEQFDFSMGINYQNKKVTVPMNLQSKGTYLTVEGKASITYGPMRRPR